MSTRRGARLRGAKLLYTSLANSDLSAADLSHTTWRGAQAEVSSFERCNLADPFNVAFWRGPAIARRFLGALGGPPCETWCAMRGMHDGPRVIRKVEQPWGIPGIS